MRALKTLLWAMLASALLVGCGFHLRGSSSAILPYQTFHVALPENMELGIWLRRYIKSSGGTKLTEIPEEADAILQQLYDNRQKTLLSVNAQGLAREYRLEASYGFRVINPKGQVLVPPQEITLSRDISFNDSAVLAKGQEEALLWRDINTDLVNQIIRRLSIIKPRDPNQPQED